MPTAHCHLYVVEHSLGIASRQLCLDRVQDNHQFFPDTLAISATLPRAKYILVNLETLGLFVPSLFSPHRGIPKLKTIFGNYFSVSNFECLSLRLGASIINLYGSVIEFVISLGACTIKLDGFLFCDKRKNFRSAESKTFFP